ncbi:hypothetical protein BKA62DRAFT_721799 [Auriculariales sp. MPI-PUGE-AT-0066]|nr:hypothetical protein BKA62DRAFT_721799 [Auriculariales sp. MPI-PUGE-AT-0066]
MSTIRYTFATSNISRVLLSFEPGNGRRVSQLELTLIMSQAQPPAYEPPSAPCRTPPAPAEHHLPPDSRPPIDDDIGPSDPLPPYSESARNPILARVDHDVKLVNISAVIASRVHERTGPLDPPPECFSTPTPLRIRSKSFQTFRVPSVSARIVDGFQPLYASEQLSTHGITAEDWADLLLGIRMTTLTAGQPNRSLQSTKELGPFILAGLAGRGFAGRQYDRAFAKTALEEAMALVAVWDGSAFARRKLRVSIHPRSDDARHTLVGYDLLVEAL